MKQIQLQLIFRDIKKAFHARTILIWAALSLICIFFFYTSSGKHDFIETKKIEYMSLFLPQIIFGAWAVLSVYFDLISSDREHNVLDCILCSGITKTQVYISKILASAIISSLIAIIYLLPITLVLVKLGGSFGYFSVFLKYLFPLWGFIVMFAYMGLLISVIARSSKAALIWSLAIGLILMPRFTMIIIEGIGSIFHWSDTIKNNISMVAPGIMLEALSDYSNQIKFCTAIGYFVVGITLFIIIAGITFHKQDEYNYGE